MASQLPTMRVDDQVWNAIEKNTFLHFLDEAQLSEECLGIQFRRQSVPACFALAAHASSIPTEMIPVSHSDDTTPLAEERRKSEPAQLSQMHFDDQSWNRIQSEKATSLHSDDEDSLTREQLNIPIGCRSKHAQLSTVNPDDQTWSAIKIEKNTFVHFVDEASLAAERLQLYFRRRSDPACCLELRERLYSSETYASTEAPDSALTSEGMDSVGLYSVASDSEMQEHLSEDQNANSSSSEVLRQHESYFRGFPVHEEALEVRFDETFVHDVKENRERPCGKGKPRPCKGKRLRFRKFIEQVQKQINADPRGCDLENLVWPAVLLESELGRIRTKVLANLRAYRNELLAQLSNGGVNPPKVQLNLAQFL